MAEINTARVQVATSNAHSPVGADIMRNAQSPGPTRVSSLSSKVAEMQEEIGNVFTKFTDKKTLGDRKIRQGQGLNLEALKRLSAARDRLPDMPQSKEFKQLILRLEQFQDLLDEGAASSQELKQNVLDALQDFDPDITHQNQALLIAQQHFEAVAKTEGTAGSHENLLSVLQEIETDFAKPDAQRDIKAGAIAAPFVAEQAKNLARSPLELRDTYRQMLREESHFGRLIENLGQYNESQNFDTTLKLFMDIAASDLSATNQSTDPNFLHALLVELDKIKNMKSVLDFCGSLISQTRQQGLLLESTLDRVGLTERLLNFSTNPNAAISDSQALIKGLERMEPAPLLRFTLSIQNIHRDIPDKIIGSNTARLQQNLMLERLVEQLTEAEEAHFEQLEPVSE